MTNIKIMTKIITKIKTNLVSQLLIMNMAALLLSACSNSGVEVTANFANTQDIKEGTAVFFENELVGEVSDVSNKGTGSLIALQLNEEAARLLTSNAGVVVNRLKEGAPLEIYNRDSGDQTAIESGQQLQGFDSMFQLGAWMVGDALQIGTASVSDYISSFQDYIKGDQFQKDKAQVSKQINQATGAAKEVLKKVEADITKAVEDLSSQEGEAAKIIEQLGEELSPLVEELAKSGSTLGQQLEQFTQGLQNAEVEEQQADQNLINSLVAMLEKLNSSIEKGIEQEAEEVTPEEIMPEAMPENNESK